MDSPNVERVHRYWLGARTLVWAAVTLGIALVLAGFFRGTYLAVVGELLVVLGALRTWPFDLVPGEVIAARLGDRDRLARAWAGQSHSPSGPSPPAR